MLLLIVVYSCIFLFFFFNDTATTEIYTLSLHDALPISQARPAVSAIGRLEEIVSAVIDGRVVVRGDGHRGIPRSEEHTSELQSQSNLVCRLLLEKKKKKTNRMTTSADEIMCYPHTDIQH